MSVSEATSVAVVIVTFQSEGTLDDCLGPLLKENGESPFASPVSELAIIDNNSTDGTIEKVKQLPQAVTKLFMDRNQGFAAGVNLGFHRTTADYVLLLNPDAVIEPDAIAELAGYLDAHHDVAAVGPSHLDAHGYRSPSHGDAPSVKLLWSSFLDFVPPLRDALNVPALSKPTPLGVSHPLPVEYLCGGAMMIRKDVWKQLGPFDEAFFLYFEETDFCVRAREAGHGITLLPTVTAKHSGGHSADQSRELADFAFLQSYRTYIRKHFDKPEQAWSLLRLLLWVKVIGHAILRLIKPDHHPTLARHLGRLRACVHVDRDTKSLRDDHRKRVVILGEPQPKQQERLAALYPESDWRTTVLSVPTWLPQPQLRPSWRSSLVALWHELQAGWLHVAKPDAVVLADPRLNPSLQHYPAELHDTSVMNDFDDRLIGERGIFALQRQLRDLIGVLLFEDRFLRGMLITPIQDALAGSREVLELGAGRQSSLHFSGRPYRMIGLDIHQPSLTYARERGVYDEVLQGNVLDLESLLPQNAVDAVVAMDLIEHLPKEKGYELLDAMERTARKTVILFTPNGFLPQPPAPDNPFQEHLSGWSYAEMRERGYEVQGVMGWKPLRGMYADVRIRPASIGVGVSNLSWLLLKVLGREDQAFALLCTKRMG